MRARFGCPVGGEDQVAEIRLLHRRPDVSHGRCHTPTFKWDANTACTYLSPELSGPCDLARVL